MPIYSVRICNQDKKQAFLRTLEGLSNQSPRSQTGQQRIAGMLWWRRRGVGGDSKPLRETHLHWTSAGNWPDCWLEVVDSFNIGLLHYFTHFTHLWSWVFGSCCDKKQKPQENQRGTGNEGDIAHSHPKVWEAVQTSPSLISLNN